MEDLDSAPWLRRLLTAALLAVLVLLGFRVIEPFIIPLVWAGILAYLTWPTHRRLLRRVGERRNTAALLMTAAVSAAVIAPLAWLGARRRRETIVVALYVAYLFLTWWFPSAYRSRGHVP